MLIVLAGTDGAGKSTQCEYLQRWLTSMGVPCRVIDKWDVFDTEAFPECRFLQPDLDQLRVCIAQMQGPARALFLIWSIATVMKQYQPCTDQVYLLDGYWMKHLAAEALYGNDEQWLFDLVSPLPVADRVLYFDIEVGVTGLRKQAFTPYECGCEEIGAHTFSEHQAKLKKLMDRWSHALGWTVIDADQPAYRVSADLRNILLPLLKERP